MVKTIKIFGIRTQLTLFVFTLLMLLSGHGLSAELTAFIDRYKVGIDDTITLTIRYTGSTVIDRPDMGDLEDNFDIVGSSQNSSFQFMNGRKSSVTEWTYALLAKKTGKLVIPAFELKGRTSDPITIDVVEQSATPQSKSLNDNLFVTAELDKTEAYVQEMMILTFRFHTAVNITMPNKPDIRLPGFIVEDLGQAEYKKRIGDKNFHIVEYRFALFPNQSGSFTLPRLRHEIGVITNQSRSLQNFPGMGFGQRTQRHYLSTNAINLTIKPKPSNSSTNWLPAQDVSIHDSWTDNPVVEAGAAITRTLQIKALGNAAEILPPLAEPSIRELKTYPEPPELKNQQAAGNLIGTRTQTTAIVPVKPGTYTLPAIKLQWWDTRNNTFKTATVPARTLTVTPAAEALITDISTTNAAAPHSLSSPDLSAQTSPAAISTTPANPVWKITTLVFAAMWLLTLAALAYIYHRNRDRHTTRQSNEEATNNASLNQAWKTLQQACHNNEPEAARQALIQWAALYWQQPTLSSLNEIAAYIDDPGFETLCQSLNSVLFSQNRSAWQGNDLLNFVEQLRHQKKTATNVELPGLYQT